MKSEVVIDFDWDLQDDKNRIEFSLYLLYFKAFFKDRLKLYRTGKGYHVIITVDGDFIEAQNKLYTIRLLLHDDPYRFEHDAERLYTGSTVMNMHFEKKFVNGKVVSEEVETSVDEPLRRVLYTYP